MNLGRTWSRARRREAIDRLSLPTRDDFQPLDTREQLELVSSFERQHALSSRLWRGIFSAILLIFVGFLIYSIFQQVLHPWEWRFHAYFMEDISSWAVTLADLAGILACLMAVMGLQVAQVPVGCHVARSWPDERGACLLLRGAPSGRVLGRDKKAAGRRIQLQGQLNL
ncbi:histone-lysine N-methyltransferase isoform X2 [Wolffia australiana]